VNEELKQVASNSAENEAGGAHTEPLVLKAVGVTKSFPGVLANDEVNFELRRGEIHALLGENGSGKTTFSKTLAGLYTPDAGTIYIHGRPTSLPSPRHAYAAGIFLIQQNFSLVERLTVAENIMLGLKEASLTGRKRRMQLARIVDESRAYGLDVDPSARIWQLSMGERQRVEIIKALYRSAQILILDEPTTVLTPQECEQLFAGLKRLASEDTSIIFISHKLPEIFAVCDRVTILRAGRSVASVDIREPDMTPHRLAQMMFGREIVLSTRVAVEEVHETEEALGLENVSCHNEFGRTVVENVSFAVRKGEIFGLTGVSGNGQRELAETIAGLRHRSSGTVSVLGHLLENGVPEDAIRKGLSYVPEDRLGTGLVPDLSISDNLVLKSAWSRPYSRFGMVNRKAIRALANKLIDDFGIAGRPQTPVGQLSGGNAQRVLLARELTSRPSVVMAGTPTRGLDIAATESVRRLLIEATRSEIGVLLISEDLDEVLELCDRIGVMYRGKVVGIVDRELATPDSLGLMMTGMTA
jgi:simple sugar transport system ATP-binding protein